MRVRIPSDALDRPNGPPHRKVGVLSDAHSVELPACRHPEHRTRDELGRM